MDNASQVIEALGGTMKVAEALSLTPSTVSSWKSAKGGIPRWWKRDIEALAAKAGVCLDGRPDQSAAA